MKFTWEDTDIESGRRVVLPHEGGEQFIIGYMPGGDSGTNWCLISLSDGAVVQHDKTKVEISSFLNRSGKRPLSL